MVYKTFLRVRKHLFVIVSLLREKPLQIRDLLTRLHLLPHPSGLQYLPDEVLVIVGFGNHEGAIILFVLKLVSIINFINAS